MEGFAALSFHRADFLDSWFPSQGKRIHQTTTLWSVKLESRMEQRSKNQGSHCTAWLLQLLYKMTSAFYGITNAASLLHPIKGTNLLGKAPEYSTSKSIYNLGDGLSQSSQPKISTKTWTPHPLAPKTTMFDWKFSHPSASTFDPSDTSPKFGKSERSPRHHKRTACRWIVELVNQPEPPHVGNLECR